MTSKNRKLLAVAFASTVEKHWRSPNCMMRLSTGAVNPEIRSQEGFR